MGRHFNLLSAIWQSRNRGEKGIGEKQITAGEETTKI